MVIDYWYQYLSMVLFKNSKLVDTIGSIKCIHLKKVSYNNNLCTTINYKGGKKMYYHKR